MPGKKVTTHREPFGLRLPSVLIRQIEFITEREGYSNRQAFVEQSIREKIDRWKAAGNSFPSLPGSEGPPEAVKARAENAGQERKRAP